LRDQLIEASVSFEQKTTTTKKATTAGTSPGVPPSFNPIVRLDWRKPEALYFQTAFVRVMPSETINTFQRWHQLSISAQAAILK
jgi:hypothetical protein